jgi:hypothetical protein
VRFLADNPGNIKLPLHLACFDLSHSWLSIYLYLRQVCGWCTATSTCTWAGACPWRGWSTTGLCPIKRCCLHRPIYPNADGWYKLRAKIRECVCCLPPHFQDSVASHSTLLLISCFETE